MLNLLRNSINAIRSISGLDSDASAFITAAGLTDPTQKSAINILVKDMKASGLWTKMKAVYPMVGGTATSMKFNLKDPRDLDAAFRLTWSGGWTYSATGATPNGTNAYADTKLVPSTVLNQDSTHLSYYSRDNNSTTTNSFISSSSSATRNLRLIPNYNGNAYLEINNNSISPFLSINLQGNFVLSRIISTQYKYYKNGAQSGATISATSTQPPSNSVYIGAWNNAGSAAFFSPNQTAFSTIGDGLTDQDAQLLNQIVEKYQVALSRGVQAAQSFYYNSAYSNEANTYLYSTQITGTTQVSAINTLINGLKANNLWAKMKAVYPFVTDKWNMLAYTEDFSNGFWNKFNSTVTSNSAIAPNDTLTADSFNDGAANSAHQVYGQINSLPIGTYTFSFYLKSNTNTKNIAIYPFGTSGTGGTGAGAVILTQNGTFVANVGSGVVSYGSQDIGNGWRRFYVVGTSTAISNVFPTIAFADGSNVSYTGTNTDAYIWGAQFELGTSASVYQPVLGANSYSANVAAQMKFNLVNPQDSDAAFRLAFSGGWTYSTNGAQPNGTNGYADTKLIPSAVLSSANSQHYSVYSRTDIAEAKYGYGNDDVRMALKWSDNNFYAKMGTSESGFGANSTSLGLHILNRVNSSNLSVIVRGTKTTLSNSISSLSALSIALGARQLSGSVDSYGTRQLALASIGDGLSDAEIAILNQLVTDYETTLNRNV